ncbi:unannotated protein [freshwater metagenome]|uniref:Unannotated protein n=1 Tax=freshwater metagenome TaxID=449393 RepID=A0A6J7C003_9ZZZZ
MLDGLGHPGPRSALLSNHHRGGDLSLHDGVEFLQEGDGVEVLATAVAIRDPAAGRARVVEIQHAGDRVDAQSVDVELVEPIQRVGDQKVAHLGAPVVEDVRAPVGVLTLTRVGVFVERRAVEAGETPVVLRKVRRNPVDDDTDAAPMQRVDHRLQIVRCAVASRRRVVPADLIAPRPAERMLGHRHQLHVSEPHR